WIVEHERRVSQSYGDGTDPERGDVRAAVATGINETEPLSMLELRDDWPEPVAPYGHTIVRVAATSINMHDLWSMRGIGVRADQFPMVLGCDIAGWDERGNEVIVSGSFGNPDAGHGDESFDPDRALISERFPGAFADLTIVPLRNLVPKPAFMTMEEAGCITVAWTTAFRMLFTRGCAQPGETVLIQGAGGGVATAAIALARAAGLRVIVTSRSADKLRRALELGAHEVLETGARLSAPADLVIETVGEATWKHSLRSVRMGGRVVVSGATTGGDASAELSRVFYRQISIIGVSGASRVETEQLLRFMEAADLHPVVDSVYPIEQIHAAFERAQQPDLFGKVVVRIGQP
ncbi:MAG TPA: zinc-binding dehydrogenase, partial [Ilumatobacteraceae bacterium]|nr:zinc-binding dehydrogenase [Ilumatobacteraceae bacterium]